MASIVDFYRNSKTLAPPPDSEYSMPENADGWRKMTPDKKMIYIFDYAAQESPEAQRELREVIFSHAHEYKEFSKGRNIIAVAKKCAVVPGDREEYTEKKFTLKTTGGTLVFPEYYKSALANDSKFFERLFFGPFKTPADNVYTLDADFTDLRTLIELWEDDMLYNSSGFAIAFAPLLRDLADVDKALAAELKNRLFEATMVPLGNYTSDDKLKSALKKIKEEIQAAPENHPLAKHQERLDQLLSMFGPEKPDLGSMQLAEAIRLLSEIGEQYDFHPNGLVEIVINYIENLEKMPQEDTLKELQFLAETFQESGQFKIMEALNRYVADVATSLLKQQFVWDSSRSTLLLPNHPLNKQTEDYLILLKGLTNGPSAIVDYINKRSPALADQDTLKNMQLLIKVFGTKNKPLLLALKAHLTAVLEEMVKANVNKTGWLFSNRPENTEELSRLDALTLSGKENIFTIEKGYKALLEEVSGSLSELENQSEN